MSAPTVWAKAGETWPVTHEGWTALIGQMPWPAWVAIGLAVWFTLAVVIGIHLGKASRRG